MTDVLIRDFSDDVTATLEIRADRPGLSRSEYLRRRLALDAATLSSVSVGYLARAGSFGEPAGPDVTFRAWSLHTG